MNIFPLLLISVTLLGGLAVVKADSDAGKTLPMEEWLDPGDMIHYDVDSAGLFRTQNGPDKQTDCGSLQARLLQCQKDLEKMPSSCPACAEKTVANASPCDTPCDTPYFKKLARTILEHIKDYGSYEVTVTASRDDISTLEKFVRSDSGNVQDVSEVIIGILTNFKGKDLLDFSQWDAATLSYLTKEAILLSVAVILIICAVVIFEMRTNLSWRSQLWLALFVGFIVSIPWEWYHLYRKAFASKQAQMAKENEIPKHCRPDHELHPWESLKLWFSNSFTFSDDICIRYQETLLVDPFWEVSPAKAISATVATVIAQPFEQLAEAMGKSFRALFREVPIQWQPVVFIAVIIIIIIAMFTLSGLQVRLPFMTLTTVPALPGNFQAELRRLENQVKNVGETVAQLNNAAVHQREAVDNAPLQGDIHNKQIEILNLLKTISECQQRRAELAIQGGRGQQEQGSSGPVVHVAAAEGVKEEKPENHPIVESSKYKVPVQNSDLDTKVGVEDVGSSEES